MMPFLTQVDDEREWARAGVKVKKETAFRLDHPRLFTLEEAQVRSINDRADPATVERYVQAMKNGAQFPPIVIAEVPWSDGKPAYTKIDAHNRVDAAIQVGMKTFPAYVLSDAPFTYLKATALRKNASHGLLLDEDQALQAVAELLTAGMKVDHLARLTGLKRSKIDRAAQALRFNNRLQSLDLDLSPDQRKWLDNLKPTARAAVNRSISHDPLLAEVVKLVVEAEMPGSEASGLAREVGKAKSDADAMRFIEGERDVRRSSIESIARGMRPPRPSFVQQFRMHTHALLGIQADAAVDFNVGTRDSSAKLAADLLAFARKLVAAYGAESHAQAEEAA
jgi:ParB-like chromosome segregation protein Spo0J